MKTKPIGVRFREDVIDQVEKEHGFKAPQKVLIFLEAFYMEHSASVKKKAVAKLPSKLMDEAIPPHPAPELRVKVKPEAIQRRIAEIEAETPPKERDTPLGRKSFELEKKQRIEELKKKL